MAHARNEYNKLATNRDQFLNIAYDCAELTIPTLLMRDENPAHYTQFKTPWQSVGAKGVVTLSSKLMLGLLPPSTSFFKLQLDDSKLGVEIPPEAKSEMDLSFAKIERMIMESIAASTDRVQIFSAIKHLVVTGNALIYMGQEGMKMYPLNRYVVDRDGNGNVIKIITREKVNRDQLGMAKELVNDPNKNDSEHEKDVNVYTCVKLTPKGWIWYQEVHDQLIPGSEGKAPKDKSPFLPLRFVTVDGEDYGRSRVEEFLGDLKSLESLMQALVEGSAAAAKVIFTVSPSSVTKPQSLAFLILNVRQSERTTAEEVRMTQMELEQQLGGLFSLLTTEFLIPYLNRKMHTLQKSKQIPTVPKNLVKPTIVAGINALGRGQDRDALVQFITTIAQTLGPEALMRFVNADEAIKRLAAAQGIDVLNLVKSLEEQQAEQAQAEATQMQSELVKQAGQFASAPAMDPSKNPEAIPAMQAMAGAMQDQPPQQ